MKNLFVFLFLCGTIISCKYNPSPTGTNGSVDTTHSGDTTIRGKQIYPLTVGNQWVYSVTTYKPTTTTFDTVRISGLTTYRGHTVYKVADGKDTLLDYYVDSTLYTVNYGQASLVLRYPMNAGDFIVLQDTLENGDYIIKEVVVMESVNESVTVPAGTFNAIHVDDILIAGQSIIDTSSIVSKYYVPGIGKIKEEYYNLDQNLHRIKGDDVELVSYHVK